MKFTINVCKTLDAFTYSVNFYQIIPLCGYFEILIEISKKMVK